MSKYPLLRICSKFPQIICSFTKNKKDVLFYLGMYNGSEFDLIFKNYKTCYCFEANPIIYEMLLKKYKNFPHVRIYNVAVATMKGEIEFNISSNDGESSSIGNFDEYFHNETIKMVKTIKVPSINLFEFIRENKIEHINNYISDIQGFDLEVLKTLKPLIDQKQINTITCEVTKDSYRNIYKDLPDNSESGFHKLLDKNYACVAKGWGILEDGDFSGVPEEWWEMDCKWRVK